MTIVSRVIVPHLTVEYRMKCLRARKRLGWHSPTCGICGVDVTLVTDQRSSFHNNAKVGTGIHLRYMAVCESRCAKGDIVLNPVVSLVLMEYDGRILSITLKKF